jgi:hypothetical protein
MTIYKGSRYEYSTIDYVATNTDYVEKPLVLYAFTNLGLVNYWQHTYQSGERLDQIAYKYYKRPEFWWVIPEFNPGIDDFNNITPGTVLVIPNV